MTTEPSRRPQHDPRTEWIADGCASWLTGWLVGIPVLIGLLAVATLAGRSVTATWAIALAGVVVVRGVQCAVRWFRTGEEDSSRAADDRP